MDGVEDTYVEYDVSEAAEFLTLKARENGFLDADFSTEDVFALLSTKAISASQPDAEDDAIKVTQNALQDYIFWMYPSKKSEQVKMSLAWGDERDETTDDNLDTSSGALDANRKYESSISEESELWERSNWLAIFLVVLGLFITASGILFITSLIIR